MDRTNKKTIGFKKIDPVEVRDTDRVVLMRTPEKVIVDKQTKRLYEEALDPKLSFRTRVRRFFAGTSRTGRWGSVIKDFILFFVPKGDQIDEATEFLSNKLFEKSGRKWNHKIEKARSAMSKQKSGILTWLKRRLKEPGTYQGLVGIAGVVGVSLSPELAQAITTFGVGLISLIQVVKREMSDEDHEKKENGG